MCSGCFTVRALVWKAWEFQQWDQVFEVEQDSRKAWQIFADNYHLFHGTPSRMWMDHALTEVLGVDLQLNGDTAGVI